jgi:hypothetical protein
LLQPHPRPQYQQQSSSQNGSLLHFLNLFHLDIKYESLVKFDVDTSPF